MLVEPKDSYIASVRHLHFSQAHLASAYESERHKQFYAQKLEFQMRILPRRVRDVLDALLSRGDQNGVVVILSRERGKILNRRRGSWRHVRQYQLVLRST